MAASAGGHVDRDVHLRVVVPQQDALAAGDAVGAVYLCSDAITVAGVEGGDLVSEMGGGLG